MSFTEIEASYNKYLEIENQLTPDERIRFLRGYQELIKLYKLNVELETMTDNM